MMTRMHVPAHFIVLLIVLQNSNAISSPIQPYDTHQFSTELQHDVAYLWWTIDQTQQSITFELHVHTTGWIALGISPAGGMKGADIGLGWVDSNGQAHFQSGSNIVIFAYGLEDPDMSVTEGLINYHGSRRGTRMIPLRSYGNPPLEEKFADLEYFDLKSDNYVVPAKDTTYHCKVYKVPTHFSERKHAIARKTIIDPKNRDLVHHLLIFECNSKAVFDDNYLPDGICDEIIGNITACIPNIAGGWAVGGDEIVEFPESTGYPIGGDSETKYLVIQMHYDNPSLAVGRRDNSGVRFYLGKERRQYELGYFSLGTDSTPMGIAIPPGVDRFNIDSYCPAEVTKGFPKSGITIMDALPHTHLQGFSIWTKIIRNRKAVDYLFNAESYDFNYQFENRLSTFIQLYPGDELATRCVYTTLNKDEVTLGGERTREEMCFHTFTYYPRLSNIYSCLNFHSQQAWQKLMNVSESAFNQETLKTWLQALNWTTESRLRWQKFYNNEPHTVVVARGDHFDFLTLDKLPDYEDLKQDDCTTKMSSTAHRRTTPLTILTIISIFIKTNLLK